MLICSPATLSSLARSNTHTECEPYTYIVIIALQASNEIPFDMERRVETPRAETYRNTRLRKYLKTTPDNERWQEIKHLREDEEKAKRRQAKHRSPT